MEICKEKAVAFTGHRELKSNVYLETLQAVIDHCERGYDTFLTGMAEGFDLLGAIAVLEAKKQFPHIKLVAVIPYEGQSKRFDPNSIKTYDTILHNVDHRVVLYDNYFNDVFLRRNDYLLENSSTVICYYSGQRSGTMYTVNRAKKAGMPILNLFKA